MASIVDYGQVGTSGLQSSPVAEALAGLRANEARYFKTKYDHVFMVQPAAERPDVLAFVDQVLAERSIATVSYTHLTLPTILRV